MFGYRSARRDSDGDSIPLTQNVKVHVDESYLPPEYISIHGFKYSKQRIIIYYILSFLTGGILLLVSKWFPQIKSYIGRQRSDGFRNADVVLLKAPGGKRNEVVIHTIDMPNHSPVKTGSVEHLKSSNFNTFRTVRYFDYRKQRYIYKESQSSFQRLDNHLKRDFGGLNEMRRGLDSADCSFLTQFHGTNDMSIEPEPIMSMLTDKVVHPFYIFQVISVIIWLSEGYQTYSFIILTMSVVSIAWEIYSAKVNENNLRSLSKTEETVRVLRDGLIQKIDVKKLVIGDAVVLNDPEVDNGKCNYKPCKVVCDMVLVQGNSVVVDESSLTGESVPVVKTPVPYMERSEEVYSVEKHKKHTLYCGSVITQVKKSTLAEKQDGGIMTEETTSNSIAIVVSTGFYSSKGELLRSILFPKPIDFKFYRDSYVFIAMLSIVALATFINNMVNGQFRINNGEPIIELLVASIDLITIAVPPALPLVLTVGIGIAINRLRKNKIYCIDPERMNFAGSVDVMCWDKTGTLTTSSLSWMGMEPVSDGIFLGYQETVDVPSGFLSEKQAKQIHYFKKCLATCHGIQSMDDTITGHAVDVEMFKQTQFKLTQSETKMSIQVLGNELQAEAKVEEKKNSTNNDTLYILKRFEFDAHIQRNSIVCVDQRAIDNNQQSDGLIAFSKGSPEAIKNICRPKSIPSGFFSIYQHYASKGFYVLACSYKNLCKSESPKKEATLPQTPSQRDIAALPREKVERDMIFLGFFILQNPIKIESFNILKSLSLAEIKSVIITGDNALTSIHVARELGMCKQVIMVDLDMDGQLVFWDVPQAQERSVHESGKEDKSGAFDPLRRDSQYTSQIGATNMNPNATVHKYGIEDLPHYLLSSGDPFEIAVSGSALDRIRECFGEGFTDWFICRTRIFSRAKPNHKTYIIERLISEKFVVGMCGDGTNDCGALKAAHVGLALSDAEASLVAPFTSARKFIADVPILLSEGRCSLETSFVAFKYMTLYPILQVTLTATLYQLNTALGNNQFLFDDLVIVLLAAIFMLYTGPAKRLVVDKPNDNLLNPQVLLSIVGQVIICLVYFFIHSAILHGQKWFCSATKAISQLDENWIPKPSNGTTPAPISYPCYPIDPEKDVAPHFHSLIRSYENTAIWLFGHVQFLAVALAFSIHSLHRQAFWTNIPFTLYIIVVGSILLWLFYLDTDGGPTMKWLHDILDLRDGVPMDYRFWASILAASNIVVCCVWEFVFIGKIVVPWMRKRHIGRKTKDAWARARGAGVVGTTVLVASNTAGNSLKKSASMNFKDFNRQNMANIPGNDSMGQQRRPSSFIPLQHHTHSDGQRNSATIPRSQSSHRLDLISSDFELGK